MDYVKMGRTGLRVPRLWLGTMNFGAQCDEAQSVAVMNAAADHGITGLDTADVYPGGGGVDEVGLTEEIVGRWLQGKRQDYLISTKCNAPTSRRAWSRGNSRWQIMDSIDASLRRLKTDYVDLYQVHNPDPETPIDETLRALDDVVRSGKVRYVGCSNFLAYQLALSLGRSDMLNTVRFDVMQQRYSLLFRQVEREHFPLCREQGVGLLVYNPLAGGLLTGKHAGAPVQGSRFDAGDFAKRYRERYWKDRELATVQQVAALAQEASIPMTQLSIAWVLANPAVTAPIVGASRPEQLKDAVASLSVSIPAQLKAKLDELSHEYRRGDDPR